MTFTHRVIGAARRDIRVYEEVEHDRAYKTTLRAVAVCLIGWVISLVVLNVFGAMFFLSARSLLF